MEEQLRGMHEMHSWHSSHLVYQSDENITGQIGAMSDEYSWVLPHLVIQAGGPKWGIFRDWQSESRTPAKLVDS
jgi:hypothetical protein